MGEVNQRGGEDMKPAFFGYLLNASVLRILIDWSVNIQYIFYRQGY